MSQKQVALWATMLDLFPYQDGTFIEEVRKMLTELSDAYDALPESVQDDAAPEGTSLADRIRAVTMERDHARETARRAHDLAKTRSTAYGNDYREGRADLAKEMLDVLGEQ